VIEENYMYIHFWNQQAKFSLNQVINPTQQKLSSKLFPSVIVRYCYYGSRNSYLFQLPYHRFHGHCLTFRLPSNLLWHRLPRRRWLPPPRFRVRFKILHRVIQPLIQRCLLRKMVYLNIIYVIATRNYDFFTTGIVP